MNSWASAGPVFIVFLLLRSVAKPAGRRPLASSIIVGCFDKFGKLSDHISSLLHRLISNKFGKLLDIGQGSGRSYYEADILQVWKVEGYPEVQVDSTMKLGFSLVAVTESQKTIRHLSEWSSLKFEKLREHISLVGPLFHRAGDLPPRVSPSKSKTRN